MSNTQKALSVTLSKSGLVVCSYRGYKDSDWHRFYKNITDSTRKRLNRVIQERQLETFIGTDFITVSWYGWE